jgi:hypothetical protein
MTDLPKRTWSESSDLEDSDKRTKTNGDACVPQRGGDGSWMCAMCSNVNFAARTFCNRITCKAVGDRPNIRHEIALCNLFIHSAEL